MTQVMQHVDILDLVNINVARGQPTPIDPVPIRVFVEPVDRTKNVVFDESALKVLNNKMSEFVLSRQLDIRDDNTFKYIEEFVGRMVTELYKNGLMALEDVGDEPDDPYQDVRNMYDSKTGRIKD